MENQSISGESFYHISREEEYRGQIDAEDRLKELSKEVNSFKDTI